MLASSRGVAWARGSETVKNPITTISYHYTQSENAALSHSRVRMQPCHIQESMYICLKYVQELKTGPLPLPTPTPL